MQIVDANIILRYLLKDNQVLHKQAAVILEEHDVFIPYEIIAEVVYVLEKVYTIDKKEINSALNELCKYNNISFINKKVLSESLEYYLSYKLDYADSLLCAYKAIEKHDVFTFDKKLQKILKDI